LLPNLELRIHEVRERPDGALCVLSDSPNAKLLKLPPAKWASKSIIDVAHLCHARICERQSDKACPVYRQLLPAFNRSPCDRKSVVPSNIFVIMRS
jgi:hypothetical protein